MKIGAKTISACADCGKALMTDYQPELDKAFLRAEEALSVSLKFKLSPGKHGGIDIKADISFVAEQIKDSTSSHVADENQLELFEEKKVVNIDRRGRIGGPYFHPLGW